MALMFLSRRKNKRSNLNWSHVKVTDLSVGTVVPYPYVVSKGDILRFSPSSFVQAMAMKAPLVNGFKLCLEYFFAPNRLYHGRLLFNEVGVTDKPDQVLFPTVLPDPIPLKAQGGLEPGEYVDYDDEQINISFPPSDLLPTDQSSMKFSAYLRAFASVMVQEGSLLHQCGFPVGWINNSFVEGDDSMPGYSDLVSDASDRFFVSVLQACAYLDIILNYYADQQFDYLYTSGYEVVADPTAPVLPGYNHEAPQFRQVRLRLADVQTFINGLKRSTDPTTYIRTYVSAEGGSSYDVLMSWKWLCSPCSLFQRALKPYYLESWLKTSYVDGIDNVIKVDTENGGSVVFSDIRRASHMQRFFELAMAGGSRYSDYENAQFDLGRVKDYNTPLFLGSDRQFLGSRVIYQTTGFDSSDSPLGAFAGQASGGDRFKERSFKISEDGVFFVMASLVPDTIYYRGLDPSVHNLRLDDLYVPAKDNIGMEPLYVEQLDSLPPVLGDALLPGGSLRDLSLGRNVDTSSSDARRAVGYVPAWSSTMQQLSRAYNSLQGDLKYWILAREYGSERFSNDMQQRIDAALANYAQYIYGYTGHGGFIGTISTLRTFFDNLRKNSDYVPYVLNHLYNSVFADTSVGARNFVLTLSFDMTVNREKSKVNIPTTI